ncbi:MAG: ATP-dependent DNA helicase [Candidatus Nezhaarchaeales archaeon]
MLDDELLSLTPYPSLRPGQLRIARTVYLSIAKGLYTVLEAPCGLGKTVSSLMGVTPSLQRNLARRVLWFTRTNDESDKVIEEAKRVKDVEGTLRGISIRGKSSSCPRLRGDNEELTHLACRALRDELLCSYLDQEKIDLCANRLSSQHNLVTSIDIIQNAVSDKCCPAAVMKRIIRKSNIIALTYPYVFNDNVYKVYSKLLFLDPTVAIMDEAHNIAELMVEYRSKVLRLTTLHRSIDELSTVKVELVKPLEDLTLLLKNSTKKASPQGIEVSKDQILRMIAKYFKDPSVYISKLKEVALDIIKLRAVKGLTIRCPTYSTYSFLREALGSSIDHLIWAHLDFENEVQVELKPLTCNFSWIARRFHSVIFMSGTLSPLIGFIKSLSLDPTNIKAIKYVKPKYGRVIFIVDASVSTIHKNRSEQLYKILVYKLKTIRDVVETGLGIFVPSYNFLRDLKVAGLRELMPGLTLIDDGKGLSSLSVFNRFRDYIKMGVDVTLVSVIGGRLAEGVDISSRLMPVAVIVGLPMPEPTPYNLRKVEKLRCLGFKRPYEAVFVEPAMRKVSQAVGRLIRSPSDEAIVILMDKRFTKGSIKRYIPRWLNYELYVSGNPICLLQDYFFRLKLKVRKENKDQEDAS